MITLVVNNIDRNFENANFLLVRISLKEKGDK